MKDVTAHVIIGFRLLVVAIDSDLKIAVFKFEQLFAESEFNGA